MSRPKPFLTYFILCALPLLLLAGLNYWNGLRTVTSTTSAIVNDDLRSFNASVDEEIRQRENALLRLSTTPAARMLFKQVEVNPDTIDSIFDRTLSLNSLPRLDEDYRTVAFFDRNRNLVWFRIENAGWSPSNPSVTVNLPKPDQRVWTLQGNSLVDHPANGSSTREYSAPIHDENSTANIGALVGILDLESVFAEIARGLESKSNQHSMVVVTDRDGKIIYHSDRQFKNRPLSEALPASGYLTDSSPIPRLNVSVAVARNHSEATSDAHRRGIAGIVLAILGALAAAFILERHVQRRSRGIARVTEDVSAIAKGELDRRIILQSSDDARGLADNINVMTERLRAQIAREEESRQFESFVRLSAMLTHDLKNAIEGLSLTVANMERHFDNPQFRTDAMKGLTSATDKLRALVARLSRPLTSLSGEHKRPANTDLVPIIQRVLAMTAEPMRGKHSIVTRLPPSLFALVDAARIEEVIENLVLNALEAMVDKGGTLTIEAGQTDKGAPMFSISDTGRGMSRMFIETRLFRPFATTKRTGIGLGLYTCREVIQASAGSIDVESVEGAGTTFRVVLPSIPHDRRN